MEEVLRDSEILMVDQYANYFMQSFITLVLI